MTLILFSSRSPCAPCYDLAFSAGSQRCVLACNDGSVNGSHGRHVNEAWSLPCRIPHSLMEKLVISLLTWPLWANAFSFLQFRFPRAGVRWASAPDCVPGASVSSQEGRGHGGAGLLLCYRHPCSGQCRPSPRKPRSHCSGLCSVNHTSSG